jgi:hypothetical protein
MQIVLLDPQLKEKTYLIDEDSLAVEKIKPPFTDGLPPGFDREMVSRQGYRVKAQMAWNKNQAEIFEMSFLYMHPADRVLNLAVPKRHRVEDLTDLLAYVKQFIATELPSGS